MQHHVLSPGTVLNGRYRIESLLGQGGFGITYIAVNMRIELKVAIKELFWREHSARDAAISPEVALREPSELPIFNRQKERFLREARILRDFSEQSDVAHILDYFEANNTAYIVIEYVQGETLGAYLRTRGNIPAEELFRRFLPLIHSLGAIHNRGIIHRDISPDNIMVQPDGRLKLIDFGAAREYADTTDAHYTTITKDSYAPGEQYDKNGKQGPWTDVYSLCATFYTCLTGNPPPGAVQRMFLDELRAPSEYVPGLETKYETIIMIGLQMSPAKRYQSMEALADAIQAVLPPEEPPKPALHLLILVTAIALILVVAMGVVFYYIFKPKPPVPPFGSDTVTETFILTAPNGMSAWDYSQAQEVLREELENFAGNENYIITVDGTQIRVELPLELFDNRYISDVLTEELAELIEDWNFDLIYQGQVNWEDPATSENPGKNQIVSGDFTETTVAYSYYWRDNLTMGQRANLISDIKIRLDALDTPYSFGNSYGADDEIVFRMAPDRIGDFILETIGNTSLEIAGEGAEEIRLSHSSGMVEIIENTDGTFGLRCDISSYYADDLEKLMEVLLNHGQNTLYLQSGDSIAIAELYFDKPVTNGILEFQNFRFVDGEGVDAQQRYVLDYIVALVNNTDLPSLCFSLGGGFWDAKKNAEIPLDIPASSSLGLQVPYKNNEARLRQTLATIHQDTPYECYYSDGIYYIEMYLELDGKLVSNIETAVPELLETYTLGSFDVDKTILIVLIDEAYGERFRLGISTVYDPSRKELYHWLDFRFSDSGRLEPYSEDMYAWWDTFPAEDYGFEKEYRELDLEVLF